MIVEISCKFDVGMNVWVFVNNKPVEKKIEKVIFEMGKHSLIWIYYIVEGISEPIIQQKVAFTKEILLKRNKELQALKKEAEAMRTKGQGGK